METQNHTTSLAIKIILVICVICAGAYCYKANETIHYNNHVTHQENVAINQNRYTLKHTTKNQAVHDFVAHKPNLAIIEKDAKVRSAKAINLACNHQHNHQEVSKNEPIIKKFLGNNIGSILAGNTQVTTTAQGKPLQQSAKLLGEQISFGKYDDATNTLPMNILIKYKTSPFVNGSGATHGLKPSVDTYYEAFHINIKAYNTYNIVFHLKGHTRSQSGENN